MQCLTLAFQRFGGAGTWAAAGGRICHCSEFSLKGSLRRKALELRGTYCEPHAIGLPYVVNTGPQATTFSHLCTLRGISKASPVSFLTELAPPTLPLPMLTRLQRAVIKINNRWRLPIVPSASTMPKIVFPNGTTRCACLPPRTGTV